MFFLFVANYTRNDGYDMLAGRAGGRVGGIGREEKGREKV